MSNVKVRTVHEDVEIVFSPETNHPFTEDTDKFQVEELGDGTVVFSTKSDDDSGSVNIVSTGRNNRVVVNGVTINNNSIGGVYYSNGNVQINSFNGKGFNTVNVAKGVVSIGGNNKPLKVFVNSSDHVIVASSTGDVEVSGICLNVNLKTNTGNIIIENVFNEGEIWAQSNSGLIVVRDSVGSFNIFAKSISGNITVHSHFTVSGHVKTNTGSINFSGVGDTSGLKELPAKA